MWRAYKVETALQVEYQMLSAGLYVLSPRHARNRLPADAGAGACVVWKPVSYCGVQVPPLLADPAYQILAVGLSFPIHAT